MNTVSKQFIISALAFIVFTLTSTMSFAQLNTTTPERKGLLVEVSAGPAIIMLEDSEGVQNFDEIQTGFTFPDIKIGYMINQRLAVAASLPGLIFEYEGNDRHFGGLIPSVQYWVSDRFWVNGGLGLASDAPALYDINDNNDDWHFGCAATMSAGYELLQFNKWAVNLQSKVLVGRSFLEGDQHRDAASINIAIGVSWF